MPIYEYLCPDCNRVYSFLTPSFNETRVPACPRCGAADLRKQVSKFAFVRGGGKSSAPADEVGAGFGPGLGDDFGDDFGDIGGPPPDGPDLFDNPRVEREMMKLMSDAEHIDERDPRQLGQLMRRMSEISGETLDGEMEEAVRRLEAGEDPDRVDEDLGVFAEEGDGGGMMGRGRPGGRPSYDDGLYSF